MNHLRTEITNLEQNPSKTPTQQAELEQKKQKLKALEKKQKELSQPLPLANKIADLEAEIKFLEAKTNKIPEEKALLAEKKQQLEELLKQQGNSNSGKNDKIALAVGLGIGGVLVIGLVLALVFRKRNKKF